MDWFSYPTWTGDMKRSPKAKHSYETANELIGQYAGESGLTGPELARYVAKQERLRTPSSDINVVGRAFTRKLYRKQGNRRVTSNEPRRTKLTRTQEIAQGFYRENEDGIPDISFDTLSARYD
ncbi:MAG TPA: hypothetical protein VJB05_04115 [archaeon]|nr:hypothetical protein [archaeon]